MYCSGTFPVVLFPISHVGSFVVFIVLFIGVKKIPIRRHISRAGNQDEYIRTHTHLYIFPISVLYIITFNYTTTILLLPSNNTKSIIHVMCDPKDERPTATKGCDIIINTPPVLNLRNSRINHYTIWHVVTFAVTYIAFLSFFFSYQTTEKSIISVFTLFLLMKKLIVIVLLYIFLFFTIIIDIMIKNPTIEMIQIYYRNKIKYYYRH